MESVNIEELNHLISVGAVSRAYLEKNAAVTKQPSSVALVIRKRTTAKEGIANGDLSRAQLEAKGAVRKEAGQKALYVHARKGSKWC